MKHATSLPMTLVWNWVLVKPLYSKAPKCKFHFVWNLIINSQNASNSKIQSPLPRNQSSSNQFLCMTELCIWVFSLFITLLFPSKENQIPVLFVNNRPSNCPSPSFYDSPPGPVGREGRYPRTRTTGKGTHRQRTTVRECNYTVFRLTTNMTAS